MMFHHRRTLHFGVVVLLSFVVTGCQSEPEQLGEVTIDVPDQIQQDGIAWQRQPDIQESDNQCLSKFFAANQDLAGSPEFEGQPIVFASGKTDRRFYWLNPAVDGVRWRCVEFRKRKFLSSDGTENPFK